MKRKCSRIQMLITLGVDGELDESMRAEVRNHARGCPDCSEAQRFQDDLKAATEDDPMAPPAVYFEGVLAQIHRLMPVTPPHSPRRRRGRLQPQTLASSVMSIFALIWAGSGAVNFWSQGGGATSSPFSSAASRSMEAAVVVSMRAAPVLLFIEDIGPIASNSPILDLPPSFLREIGLIPYESHDRNRFDGKES